jgi:C4-dicarboxylate transporter DctM subunit
MIGYISLTILVVLLAALGTGVWISFGLYIVGVVALAIFKNMPIDLLMGQLTWNVSTTPELIALPMFILMAEILFRSKLSSSLFSGLTPWTTKLPGRLLHVNVLGCTLFAAVSGSSAATTATVGRITMSELLNRGYNKDLAMGSLAGAGTLGFLIPPSIIMIIYGVLAEASILRLFIAGIIPGILLAGAYVGYLAISAGLRSDVVPDEKMSFTWTERIFALRHLGPVLFLILVVIGSMYGGYASPSEAAAVGVLGAMLISALQGTLTWANLVDAAFGAIRTISMIGLIIAGANFLSRAMGFLGVPRAISAEIAAMDLTPFMLIALLLVFYMILGMVLEGLSTIVMTLPITLPLILHAGFDKIWFGVFLVIVVEMAQITPPVGFNLFVIQGLTGEKIGRIARATLPFFLIMVAMVFLITLFPGIVTYLPGVVSFKG